MSKESSDAFEIDTRGLDALMKVLIENSVTVELGVLGSNTIRFESETNAAIGMKHEFGDLWSQPPVPMRSFLRMPLTEMMQKYLNKSDAFTEEAVKNVLASKSTKQWMEAFGYTGEQIVFDAFNSGGFGNWTPSNMAFKKNHQTLVETQQLRNSISSRIKE